MCRYLATRPAICFRNQLCVDVGLTLFLPPTSAARTDFLVDSAFAVGAIVANNAFDKLLDDEQPLSKPHGWWKWLSHHGMVGAEGTKDATQLSAELYGVVFD